jgi:hypothetical protein
MFLLSMPRSSAGSRFCHVIAHHEQSRKFVEAGFAAAAANILEVIRL